MIIPSARLHFKGYVSALKNPEWERLNANEGFLNEDYSLYPLKRDPELLKLFSSLYKVEEDQLLIDRGIDGILELIFQTFLEKGSKVLTAGPTYGMYRILSNINYADYWEVPYGAQGELTDEFFDGLKENPSLVILCRPNNPSGKVISKEQVNKVLEQIDDKSLLIIDEAYAEFMNDDSFLELNDLMKRKNVIVCRTLSKAYSLASLRVGFAMGHPEMINFLLQFQTPYPVALPVKDFLLKTFTEDFLFKVKETVSYIQKERTFWEEKLSDQGILKGSQGNFILLKTSDYQAIHDDILKLGIKTRIFPKQSLLRISIGTPTQMDIIAQYFKVERT